jgi:hypothetical protein
MSFEVIEHGGRRYAEVIWADTVVSKSIFFSPDQSSMQFGLLAHQAGFVEAAHYHVSATRTINDLQQMFVVQKGVVAIDFFDPEGIKFREIVLRCGDAVLLTQGTHSVRVLETMQCVSVKQGPFLGPDQDKIEIEVSK